MFNSIKGKYNQMNLISQIYKNFNKWIILSNLNSKIKFLKIRFKTQKIKLKILIQNSIKNIITN